MSEHTEQQLRSTLKSELSSSNIYQPSSEQDAIFQENLARLSNNGSTKTSRVKHPWYIAVMLLIVIGFAAIIGQNYIGTSQVSNSDISSNNEMSIPELIAASNHLEIEIANIESNHNNPLHHIEILKVREDIVELDKAINQLYQSGLTSPNDDIQALWHKRLELARYLKGLYTNQYVMARI
ncbi:hypothetical protein GCM10009123_18110 [Kangiella japonica]|uniref:Uncharacterized protein n=1 Tax=Kangiella japonica TaxID=647384 RepID=A0ABN0T3E4_9GAMM